jgi:hypothetical protein
MGNVRNKGPSLLQFAWHLLAMIAGAFVATARIGAAAIQTSVVVGIDAVITLVIQTASRASPAAMTGSTNLYITNTANDTIDGDTTRSFKDQFAGDGSDASTRHGRDSPHQGVFSAIFGTVHGVASP